MSLRFRFLRGNPKIDASNRNGGDCKCNRRRFSYSLFLVFPSILPFPRDERSLTARGPVKGSPRRARSFGDCVTKSRVNAVPRDGSRRFIRIEQVMFLPSYAHSWAQKLTLRIAAGTSGSRMRPFLILAVYCFFILKCTRSLDSSKCKNISAKTPLRSM